jgi:hypothetical protein
MNDDKGEHPREHGRPELRELLSEAAHAGAEAGRQGTKLMAGLALAGLGVAGEVGARFARMASGALAGMADALDKRDGGKKDR